MSLEGARPAAGPGSVELPPEPVAEAKTESNELDPAELRQVPDLDQWDAAVQCSLCRKWRPCTAAEAPKLSGNDSGFVCKLVGFACNQEQRFTEEEIDAIF